jgi:hypothetical protein
MHPDNQRGELVGRDLVMPHVAADDLLNLTRVDPRRRVLVCHNVLPAVLILAIVTVLTFALPPIPGEIILTI